MSSWLRFYWLATMGQEAWDDALFFKRIGLHLLGHGVAAWNLEDGPVYGNTSQGFQLVALIAILIDAEHYLALVRIFSAAAMVGLFAVLARGASRDGGSPRDVALAWVVALLASTAPYVLLLVQSGMETAVALLVLAVNLIVVRRAPASRRGVAAVAATTAAVFLVRPDAVAISLVVIAAHGWAQAGRPPWRVLLACGAALAAIVAALWLYFGTPVPLAFYLKSRAPTSYTPDFVELSLVLKRRNLIGLLIMAAPLLYMAGHGRGAWSWSLLGSFALFTLYHYVLTVEVMGWYARFYAPGLVPLALAAMVAALRFRERSRLWISLLFIAVYTAGILYAYHHRPGVRRQGRRYFVGSAAALHGLRGRLGGPPGRRAAPRRRGRGACRRAARDRRHRAVYPLAVGARPDRRGAHRPLHGRHHDGARAADGARLSSPSRCTSFTPRSASPASGLPARPSPTWPG